MAVKKISIALDETVAAGVAEAASADGTSVSAWLNATAEHALILRRGLAAMAEAFAEDGEPSDEANAWARRVMDEAEAFRSSVPAPGSTQQAA